MCPHLEERARGSFLQGYCASVQARPPSVVENRRPSASVAVAASVDEVLIAITPTSLAAIGRSAHVPPAARTNTWPASPASQHTSAVGQSPLSTRVATPVRSVVHVAPPSLDRSKRPPTTRRRTPGAVTSNGGAMLALRSASVLPPATAGA